MVRATTPNHAQVCRLDAAKSVFAAQVKTANEHFMSGQQPTPGIFRIPEPTEGLSLPLRRAGLLSVLERQFMLFVATLDVTEGKIEIAAKVVQSREFQVQSIRFGGALCSVEIR